MGCKESVWQKASMEIEKNICTSHMLMKWHWSSCVRAYNAKFTIIKQL